MKYGYSTGSEHVEGITPGLTLELLEHPLNIPWKRGPKQQNRAPELNT